MAKGPASLVRLEGEPLGEAPLAAFAPPQEEDEAGGWGRVRVPHRGFRPGGACGEDPPRKPQGPVEGPQVQVGLQGVRQGLKALLQAPRLPAEEGLLHPGVLQEAVEPGGEEASFLVEEGEALAVVDLVPLHLEALKPPPVPGKPLKPHPPPLHRLLPRHPHPVGEEAEAGEVAPFLHPLLVQEGFGKHLRPSADGEDGPARLQVPLDQGEEGPKPGEVPRR